MNMTLYKKNCILAAKKLKIPFIMAIGIGVKTSSRRKHLRIHKVPADGDCLPQINENVADVNQMWEMVCNHFKQHINSYLNYFVCNSNKTMELFLHEVKKLSKIGAWDTQIGDLLPMPGESLQQPSTKTTQLCISHTLHLTQCTV